MRYNADMAKTLHIQACHPLDLHLCTTRKQARKLYAKYVVDYDGLRTMDGYSSALVNSTTGDTVHVMVITPPPYCGWVDIVGLICHESYHCAERYWEEIVEESPGEECMAYLIQAIATQVISNYPLDQGK